MGLRGPRPATAAAKIRAGVRPSRIDFDDVQDLTPAAHPMPRGMSPKARAAWRAILRDPDMADLPASADPLLKMLAQSIARGDRAQEISDRSGPVLIGYRKSATSNPADRSIHREAELQLRLRRELRQIARDQRAATRSDDPFSDMYQAIGLPPRFRVVAGRKAVGEDIIRFRG